jgi:hypothetical protein
VNPTAVENQLAGTAQAVWDIPDTDNGTFKYGDPAIQGYAVPFSVNLGEMVTFKINPTLTTITYRIDIYRLGYYSGLGARLITSIPQSVFSQTQPNCTYDTTTGLWLARAGQPFRPGPGRSSR